MPVLGVWVGEGERKSHRKCLHRFQTSLLGRENDPGTPIADADPTPKLKRVRQDVSNKMVIQ